MFRIDTIYECPKYLQFLLFQLIPWDPWLREIRADAYLGIGNTVHAISEMRALTKLTSDNTDGLFKLANLHYQLGEADPSLNEIRECLRLDPEHKVIIGIS